MFDFCADILNFFQIDFANTWNGRVYKKNPQGLMRLFKATGYSYKGICAAFKHEAAFREEVLLAAFAIPFAIGHTWRPLSPWRTHTAGAVLAILIFVPPRSISYFLALGSADHDMSDNNNALSFFKLPPKSFPPMILPLLGST